MPFQIPTPKGRLSKNAVKVWMLTETITALIFLTILGTLFFLDYYFDWKVWIGWILIGLTALTILSGIFDIFIKPLYRYKNWRYDVNEDFLQLKSGAFNEEHQLIPMTKIQAVSTNQGPLLRKYGLYSLSVETLGSSHQIPALPADEAIKLRNQIAHFAKIKEVTE